MLDGSDGLGAPSQASAEGPCGVSVRDTQVGLALGQALVTGPEGATWHGSEEVRWRIHSPFKLLITKNSWV